MDKNTADVWNCPPQPRSGAVVSAHCSGMRERSIGYDFSTRLELGMFFRRSYFFSIIDKTIWTKALYKLFRTTVLSTTLINRISNFWSGHIQVRVLGGVAHTPPNFQGWIHLSCKTLVIFHSLSILSKCGHSSTFAVSKGFVCLFFYHCILMSILRSE